MTRSEIFKSAHRTAKLNRFNFGTYKQRFVSALKQIFIRIRLRKQDEARKAAEAKRIEERNARIVAKNNAYKGKKVIVKAFGSIAFIDSYMGVSLHLIDEKGNAVWKCGTTTGNWRIEDVEILD